MLNLEEISNTITELENGNTTFDACIKLASLYIVRDHANHIDNSVIKEYQDILPQYHKFVEIKRAYQRGEMAENAVENSIKMVCAEIFELIQTLYSNTDMELERIAIKDMIQKLNEIGIA